MHPPGKVVVVVVVGFVVVVEVEVVVDVVILQQHPLSQDPEQLPPIIVHRLTSIHEMPAGH